jgi:hypothetical protein
LSNWRAGYGRNQASRSKIEQTTSRINEETVKSRRRQHALKATGCRFAPEAILDCSDA